MCHPQNDLLESILNCSFGKTLVFLFFHNHCIKTASAPDNGDMLQGVLFYQSRVFRTLPIFNRLLFACFNQAHSHHCNWNKLLMLLSIWPPGRHNKLHDNTCTSITSQNPHFSLLLQAMAFFFFFVVLKILVPIVWGVQHYDLRNILSYCPGQWVLMAQALKFLPVECVFDESNWLHFLFCSHWGQSSRFVILENSEYKLTGPKA